MCGRFAFFHEIEPLIDDLGAVDLTQGALHARFNIPPTVPIHVVTEGIDRDSGEIVRALRVAKWGLLPHFAKDESMAGRAFNARRETLIEKPTFKPFLRKYRAVIPVSGYYEWQKTPPAKTKQPHFIHRSDGNPMYLAGLVAWWKGNGRHLSPAASDDGKWLLTATIITRAATGRLADIHDRSPVFLDRAGAEAWLSCDTFESGAEAHAWINTDSTVLDDSTIESYPVDTGVGDVRQQGPELIAPAGT